MKISTHFKTILTAFLTLMVSQTQGQIMISFDGNEGKDMVKSIQSLEEGSEQTISFTYNSDRTMASLNYLIVDRYATEKSNFNLSWQEGKLNLTGEMSGESIGNVSLSLNAAHCITVDETGDSPISYTYDSNGHLTTITQDGITGAVKWENENVTEYTLGDYKRTFTYGDVVNSANMDFGVVSFNPEGFFALPLGKWSKNMPSNIKEYINGDISYDADIEYSLDEKNRIVKLIIHETEYENGKAVKNENTIIISYDENFASGIQHVSHSSTPQRVYNLSGMEIHGLSRGLNIIRNSDGSIRKQIIPNR